MNAAPPRGVRAAASLAALALAAALALPSAAAAQRISGTVREADAGPLISGGFVSLLDQAGEALQADFTAADGVFSFRVPGPGEYRLRVERIGYANWVTEPYTLTAGQTLSITVEVPRQPVRLGDLRVEVTGSCLDDPRQGEALATVWDEARKALETAVWAEDRGELTFTLTEYERTLDPRSLVTLESHSRTRPNVRLPPFRSLPARQLTTAGYAVVSRDSSVFYAPDATVLLSEEFRDAHCFGLRRDEVEAEPRLGITFRPQRRSNVIGIEGTLWLDEETAALREVELQYRHVPLPRGAERRRIGANLVFDRLPDGPFYVRDWWIRFPVGGRPMRPVRAGLSVDPGLVLVAYRQTGGSVAGALVGGRSFGTQEGVVAGVVRDSVSGEPLAGADIVLRDWDDAAVFLPLPPAAEARFGAVTDEAGAFRVTGLPDGVYAVGVDHPRLRTAGVQMNETRVVVEDRASEALELWTPSVETVFTQACPGSAPYGSTGAVVGVARDPATGLPVPGVEIEVLWRAQRVRFVGRGVDVTERTENADAVSGEQGEFVICRVPLGEPVFLRQKGAEEGAGFELVTRVAWRDVQVDPGRPTDPAGEAPLPAFLTRQGESGPDEAQPNEARPEENRPDECAEQAALAVTVLDESGLVAMPNATVVLRWADAGLGPVREETDGDGQLQLCVPPGARQATLWAEVGDATSEEVVVALEPGLAHEVDLYVLFGDGPTGRLVGRVRDARNHRPVAAAAVSVTGRPDEAQSNRQGYFVLGALPVGAYELSVRHLGYAPLTHTITVTRGHTTDVDVRVSPDPVELEPLVATVTRIRRLETQGFYERKQWGELTGGGTFFTVQDIERRNPLRITHMIADAPGVRVRCGGHGLRSCKVFSRRVTAGFVGQGCELNVYVDGVLVIRSDDRRWNSPPSPMYLDEFILPSEIGGVEVYPGAASLPAEFSGADGRCGAVVIWTK